ncbi:response regulator transcription factor [Rhodoferax sp. TS-BS-61-7]|uniref:response regulator n=1 Tax=Rhodoferax sp. TS-BS-61-7 TaxID=2094194 RepID=UPI000CF6CAA2|nr:response regulator transcription factor [Rhodoferax sp. TS-BS-61-7]PQA77733.1 DNA-binding response regulator [Rhodoferax sp. TS-BS-61-7]
MIQVVLCDDHAMIRRGIRDMLCEHVDMKVVGESGSYAELKDVLREQPCDVLVLDLNLPGRSGLDVLASIQDSHPNIKVLVVSMFSEDQYAIRSLKAGAHGYLNKAGNPDELVGAVRTVAQGRRYVTPSVSEMLVEQLSKPGTETLHARLSERELQTLLKIASGKRLADIAEELMLSPKTVSVYRARLLEKLGLSNNAELAVYAIRNDLV